MHLQTRRLPARAVWFKIHVYLALSVGLLFALLGLTGSLSVYREELDTLFNPRLTIDAAQGNPLSLDRILAAVRAAHPRQHGSWTLEMPRSPDGTITAWFEKPHETFGEFYAPLMVSVHPYTAEVVASRFWGQTATTRLLDLHNRFRLDGFGWNAVGILGLLSATSVISGLYLWWPGFGRLLRAFAVRHDAGLMRLLFDLHRLTGLCSAPVLLLLAFTGFLLTYPAILETLADSSGMGHGDGGPDIRSTAVPNNRPISLAEAVLIARGPFPSAELRRIGTPAGARGTYRINLRQQSETGWRHLYTTVWVDRWSGQIREVRDPAEFSSAQEFAARIWPLHSGEALGPAGRLVWFVIGLTPLALYIGGLLHWLHRRGAIGDRQIDFAAHRRSLAERLEHSVFRPGRDCLQFLRPRLLSAINLKNPALAEYYHRLRAIVRYRKC
jgi:uncharacterized iron-regulated membrane protein